MFRIGAMVWRCILGLAPAYLRHLCHPTLLIFLYFDHCSQGSGSATLNLLRHLCLSPVSFLFNRRDFMSCCMISSPSLLLSSSTTACAAVIIRFMQFSTSLLI